jgi:hypothetical protein
MATLFVPLKFVNAELVASLFEPRAWHPLPLKRSREYSLLGRDEAKETWA